MSIHPTAIVDKNAVISEESEIGAYCTVGPNVRLHAGVVLQSHIVVEGHTEIGEGTEISPFALIGGPPQHTGYKGEPTRLVVGKRNKIREHVTFNCGTVQGGGVTIIGDDGMYMTGAHVGHDCVVGDNVIFANNATLGGHTKVGKHVFIGGLTAIHQNCRVGDYAFIGGCAAVPSDIIPYASATGNHAHLMGLNIIGMKRRGMKRSVVHEMRAAYNIIFGAIEGTFRERVDKVRNEYAHLPEVMEIVAFIDHDTSRALMLPKRQ